MRALSLGSSTDNLMLRPSLGKGTTPPFLHLSPSLPLLSHQSNNGKRDGAFNRKSRPLLQGVRPPNGPQGKLV